MPDPANSDPGAPPERTPEMVANHQVWAWMHDTPLPAPNPGDLWPGLDADAPVPPGHWEIRGTGVIF